MEAGLENLPPLIGHHSDQLYKHPSSKFLYPAFILISHFQLLFVLLNCLNSVLISGDIYSLYNYSRWTFLVDAHSLWRSDGRNSRAAGNSRGIEVRTLDL
jgi:hypothetical protein